MPGAPEHPVTLGDLCVSQHLIIGDAVGWVVTERGETEGYGFRPATVADLISALRAEGVLVVEKGEGRNKWPEWVYFNWPTDYPRMGFITATLDGLAEAQPFPPAGGVS